MRCQYKNYKETGKEEMESKCKKNCRENRRKKRKVMETKKCARRKQRRYEKNI